MPFRLLTIPALLLLLAACCPCPQPDTLLPLPPPLTLQDQLTQFNARAAALPFVSARGSVKMTWQEKDRTRTESTDAVLRLRQRTGPEALTKHGGDAILFGRVAGQEVFQIGKNPDLFWFLVRLDTKTAWLGDPATPLLQKNNSTLRADLLLDLLALKPLREDNHPQQYYVVQRYTDNLRHVELLVFPLLTEPNLRKITQRFQPDGQPWTPAQLPGPLERIITLDRATNLPLQVTYYNPNGLPIITAKLSDYRDAPYLDGDKFRADVLPQKLPHKIAITSADPPASMTLTFDEITLPITLKDAVFRTPNFDAEGLRVERLN